MLKLACIVGPTAVGKTSLSLEAARYFNGEIISCDSMQVYRGMNIGTAKASMTERAQIPHHLIDIAEPEQEFSVARYQQLAREVIISLNNAGKLPLLVGGTGLYYQSVVDDYQFYPMQSRQLVRDKWHNRIMEQGLGHVYEELVFIDPKYAEKIDRHDEKRIVRALEVYELTGMPFSQHQIRKENVYHLAVVGLEMERQELYKRINQRVNEMMNQGLVEEVQVLRHLGCNPQCNAMQALGYKQVQWYLDGMMTYDEMLVEIKKETRRYAKRQLTWFKRDRRIHWIEVKSSDSREFVLQKIFTWLEGQLSGA
ncbi:MAG TPA: tRNA (adenosine(37)-N6)-dimethylallyltransferase MiaA [Syntrophomonadaceae bacterium]|nr:tRNA (adenosine(37)-N6)-dimethylallyltransferase MiaA [Syntrophomonadaceae bacterium]